MENLNFQEVMQEKHQPDPAERELKKILEEGKGFRLNDAFKKKKGGEI